MELQINSSVAIDMLFPIFIMFVIFGANDRVVVAQARFGNLSPPLPLRYLVRTVLGNTTSFPVLNRFSHIMRFDGLGELITTAIKTCVSGVLHIFRWKFG